MRRKENNIREKITKNAQTIFARKGFFRATVEDIAQATGVAKGTVYLYFKDKQELYIATIDAHFSWVLSILTEIEARKTSAADKMHDITVQLAKYLNTLKTTSTVFSFENVTMTGKALKHMHSIIGARIFAMTDIISRIVKQGIENGEFRNVDPKVVAFYFLNTIRTMFFSHFYAADSFIRTDTVLELFFEGLKKRR